MLAGRKEAMLMAPSEEKMWNKQHSNNLINQIADDEVNVQHKRGEKRILRQIGREKLPRFVQDVKDNRYVNVNSPYQRRVIWDKKKQSRLIESFLMNIPVPPIILYEKKHKTYEVIDGIQRIIAIRDFLDNKFELTDLEFYPELNGLRYKQLPFEMSRILDNSSISTILLIPDESQEKEEISLLKRIVFERLNSSGESLSHQEFRSYIYNGELNKLLIDLAGNRIFANAWGITLDKPQELAENKLYQKMEDAELVLRFFALRHVEDYRGELSDFLDIYMMKSMNFSSEDINILKEIFAKSINLAHEIYGENLFKPFDSIGNNWKDSADKAYYDAVMVGFSRHLEDAEILVARKSSLIEKTKNLFVGDKSKVLIRETNSKAGIQSRIQLFDEMLSRVIAEI